MKPGPKPHKWAKVAKFLKTKKSQKMTETEIAKHCGVSVSTVSTAWSSLRRGRREMPKRESTRKVCEEAARLWAGGLSKAEVAARQGVTRMAAGLRIEKYCKENGVRCGAVVKHQFVKVAK